MAKPASRSTRATTRPATRFANVDLVALDEMTDAIAHAILTFAMTSSAVQGTDKGSDKAAKYDPQFRGPRRHQVVSKYHVWGGPLAAPIRPVFARRVSPALLGE